MLPDVEGRMPLKVGCKIECGVHILLLRGEVFVCVGVRDGRGEDRLGLTITAILAIPPGILIPGADEGVPPQLVCAGPIPLCELLAGRVERGEGEGVGVEIVAHRR